MGLREAAEPSCHEGDILDVGSSCIWFYWSWTWRWNGFPGVLRDRQRTPVRVASHTQECALEDRGKHLRECVCNRRQPCLDSRLLNHDAVQPHRAEAPGPACRQRRLGRPAMGCQCLALLRDRVHRSGELCGDVHILHCEPHRPECPLHSQPAVEELMAVGGPSCSPSPGVVRDRSGLLRSARHRTAWLRVAWANVFVMTFLTVVSISDQLANRS
mmetsp:Transcript_71448/g.220894  ORF Transcript_71448/g.220894 Transcript_71448/m.220894 type:complete len:215 (-) Transcript_71448:203-847(-)